MALGLAAARSERYHCESMTAKLGALVSRAAAALGGTPLGEPIRDAIALWLERLEEWNARIDLTAARSREELVDLMVADALVLAPRMPTGARVVDVGTGAGAPGLALALLRADLRVTLVEPLGEANELPSHGPRRAAPGRRRHRAHARRSARRATGVGRGRLAGDAGAGRVARRSARRSPPRAAPCGFSSRRTGLRRTRAPSSKTTTPTVAADGRRAPRRLVPRRLVRPRVFLGPAAVVVRPLVG